MDEYSSNRALKPSIVDAISDRLRPVLLTTLTTVLGLTPLLFETSKDAQFLKPTIVTLVYGLGFGMLIVLFLVPAIVVIQRDFFNLIKAFKMNVFNKKSSILFKTIYLLSIVLLAINVLYFLLLNFEFNAIQSFSRFLWVSLVGLNVLLPSSLFLCLGLLLIALPYQFRRKP